MRLEASGLHHLRLAVIPADVFSSLATTHVVLSIHQVREMSRKMAVGVRVRFLRRDPIYRVRGVGCGRPGERCPQRCCPARPRGRDNEL